jgi:hypothetical protein
MRAARTRSARLGTFAAVFTPSVPTILGLILVRRLGYVVDAAGLLQALVLLTLAAAAAERAARALAAAGEPAPSPAITKSEQKKAHA